MIKQSRNSRRLVGVALAVFFTAALTGSLGPPEGSGGSQRASATTLSPCASVAAAPKYKHVIVIVEENHSYRDIIGSSAAPFTNSLAGACGLATHYHAVTHHSLPNYLALVAGVGYSSLGPYVNDCLPTTCSHLISGASAFSQSVGHGGWRTYAESMPSRCATTGSGTYAPKHNPALYLTGLAATCANYDVSLGTTSSSPLLRALSSELTTPAFSLVVPDLCHDTHDCSIATGDAWLSLWMAKITASAVYRSHDTAIFVTWDEGEPAVAGENCVSNDTDPSCRVATIVVAPSVHRGTRSATSFSHYSLLATAEQLLGYSRLGGARYATSMVGAFNL